jgi:hypothetical protein
MIDHRRIAAEMLRHARLIGRVKKTVKLPRENIREDLK